MFGPIIGETWSVRCPNPQCPAHEKRPVSVPIPEAAPGVLAVPRLVCSACGSDVNREESTRAQ